MIALSLHLLAFLVALWIVPRLEGLWHWLFPDVSRPLWSSQSWFALLGEHLALSLGAAASATCIGLAMGVLATRPWGRPLRPLLDSVFAFAQAVPPIAVIALALPMLGFGAAPTLLALVLYSALPVMRSTIAALETVPAPVLDAARGSGMGSASILARVELPLSMPVIQAGVRVAVVLAIATTAVGSVAGAECLGTPIISGLANGNMAWVLQGGVFTAWLALLTDHGMRFGFQALTPHALLIRGEP